MSQPFPRTSRSLPIALLRAREQVMAPIRDMLADSGLTEQQWRVMRVLSEDGPMDTTTLADRACLLFPSLTRIVATLRAKDLVTQTRDDSDRRRQFVAITRAGQSIIDSNQAQAAQIAERFRAQLGEAAHEQLLDLLGRLATEPEG